MTTSTKTQPGVWPSLSFRDAEAAVTYLVDVVGFAQSVVHRGDADRPISHAELLWPSGGGIMFGSDLRAVGGRAAPAARAPRPPISPATTLTASRPG
jgi:uncharacterized glyoxalase superfamily protein PhnB